MISLTTIEQLFKHCSKQDGRYCDKCRKNYPELKHLCDKNFGDGHSLFDLVGRLMPLIVAHNRKQKLEKLLK